MNRALMVLLLAVGLVCGVARPADEPFTPKLLIAFASTRERRAPPYPKIYFYEHDGIANGKLVGSIDAVDKGANAVRSDTHPSLSRDGRLCTFASQIGVQDGGRIEVWDRQDKKLLDHPSLNLSAEVHQVSPSFSADARLIAFSAWARPGSTPRWAVFVYDVTEKKDLELPKLNSETFDQRMPAISADGRFLAYVSNAKGGVGLTDIYLYDLKEKQVLALPEMNSKNMDVQPSLSGDGRLVAFASDRPDGAGGRDIYLYDRTAKRFLPLPGLNSAAHDHSPSISADGRYIAFVSERLGGAGERDIYLYDRETQKLLPTPGLNSKDDDFDPCVLVLPAPK